MKKPVCVSPHQYGSISYRSCHNYTFKFKLRRKITHLFPIHQTIPHFSAKINNHSSGINHPPPVRLADQFLLIAVQFLSIAVPQPRPPADQFSLISSHIIYFYRSSSASQSRSIRINSRSSTKIFFFNCCPIAGTCFSLMNSSF